MPQLQINQGPQDALLFDNGRSYFTNVGYVRTSNFQVEYRNNDSQNNAALGTTVQFVLPKAADLLGPVDLVVDLEEPSATVKNGIGLTTSTSPHLLRDSGTAGYVTSTTSGSDTIDHAPSQILGTNDAATTEFARGSSVSGASTNWDQTKASKRSYVSWVDELGFAMIEKATFSIGSNDIETLTGEQMQIRNALMTSDEQRLGHMHTLQTGMPVLMETTPLTTGTVSMANSDGAVTGGDLLPAYGQGRVNPFERPGVQGKKVAHDYSRVILMREELVQNLSTRDPSGKEYLGSTKLEINEYKCGKRQLIIPLSFFFTKHVSQYFPLVSVAGCNDVRISIKFRNLDQLIQKFNTSIPTNTLFPQGKAIASAALRSHYVHVTGPEANTLMNKEHVRLLKLWQHIPFTGIKAAAGKPMDLDLSFLHPVSTLLITVRDENQVGSGDDKNAFFAYHGDGTNPTLSALADYASASRANSDGCEAGTCKIGSIQLSLNGQERHPGLDKGVETNYLQHRLLPMLHSNSNCMAKRMYAISANSFKYGDSDLGKVPQINYADMEQLAKYQSDGCKNIFAYPFALNPEGSNPSGSVNFSKVSHAKLKLHVDTSTQTSSSTDVSYRIDVYALYYNWLQIKDGRALLSFA